jgi:hypothetical protein
MDDQRYYRRRVTEEQIAALGSEDARVRRVHIEMAGRYRDLVRSVTSRGEGELRLVPQDVEVIERRSWRLKLLSDKKQCRW